MYFLNVNKNWNKRHDFKIETQFKLSTRYQSQWQRWFFVWSIYPSQSILNRIRFTGTLDFSNKIIIIIVTFDHWRRFSAYASVINKSFLMVTCFALFIITKRQISLTKNYNKLKAERKTSEKHNRTKVKDFKMRNPSISVKRISERKMFTCLIIVEYIRNQRLLKNKMAKQILSKMLMIFKIGKKSL